MRGPTALSLTAIGLLSCSVAWLPLNNGRLEGQILITLNYTQGVTLSDVLSLSGITISALILAVLAWRSGPREERIARTLIVLGLCCVALAFGVGLTLATG
ncbi:MAG: hypothetical protein ABI232_11165 [Jatrophihabitantaceae bacterium]